MIRKEHVFKFISNAINFSVNIEILRHLKDEVFIYINLINI